LFRGIGGGGERLGLFREKEEGGGAANTQLQSRTDTEKASKRGEWEEKEMNASSGKRGDCGNARLEISSKSGRKKHTPDGK